MKGCGDKCAKRKEHQVQRHYGGTCVMHARYEGKARVEISQKSRAGRVRNGAGKGSRGQTTEGLVGPQRILFLS